MNRTTGLKLSTMMLNSSNVDDNNKNNTFSNFESVVKKIKKEKKMSIIAAGKINISLQTEIEDED